MSSENPENPLPNSINDHSNWIDEDEPTVTKSESNSWQNTPKTSTKTLVMVETAFLASTASLIWLINFYFPLGPILKIFFPIPLAFLCLRRGVRAGWMAMLVSGLLLSVLMGPSRSILYLMPYGLMGVQLGILWRRGSGWLLSILIGTIIGTIGFFFRFWIFSLLLGEDVWVYVISQFSGLADWLFINLGLMAQPSIWVIEMIAFLMIVVNNLFYLFTVHLVALLVLERLGNPIPQPPRWVKAILDYE